MGQAPMRGVRDSLPPQISQLTNQLIFNASEIQQRTTLTYDQFLDSLATLTELASKVSDVNGKQLVFLVKKGTDHSMMWRGTVRIKCHKVNCQTNAIESSRLLTLKQYLRLYNEISLQATRVDDSSAAVCLDTSMLLAGSDAASSSCDNEIEECVICMDRPSSATLPCTHSFCEKCITDWQGSHRNCPVCRATVTSKDEAWVLLSKPTDSSEMDQDLLQQESISGLIDRYSVAAPDSDSD